MQTTVAKSTEPRIKTLEGFNRNVVVKLKHINVDPLIQLKKYSDTFTGIGPGIDKNGFPVTGLTEDYYEEKTDKTSKMPRKIEGTRRSLEKELGLEEGTLKNTSDFWNTFFVKVGAEEVRLELESPHDLLKYLFCLGQSIVTDASYVSKKDRSSKVEFELYSEELVAKNKSQARQNLKKAYALSQELDMSTKIDILAVYGEIADASAPYTIENAIDEKIEENPKLFLTYANDSHLVFRSLINKCKDKGILLEKDGAVYHEEIILGHTPEQCAEAVAKNTKLQAILKAKLTGDLDLIKEALNSGK